MPARALILDAVALSRGPELGENSWPEGMP
jgi:hypothetical protein